MQNEKWNTEGRGLQTRFNWQCKKSREILNFKPSAASIKLTSCLGMRETAS
jgi:hypothetical protein